MEATPRAEGKMTGASAMLFNIPGASTDTDVSYEEWQNAYHAHQQSQVATPTSRSAEAGSLSPPRPPCSATARGSAVVEAWGSSDSLNTQQASQQGEVASQQGVEGRVTSQQQGAPHQRKKDAIKNEWLVCQY